MLCVFRRLGRRDELSIFDLIRIVVLGTEKFHFFGDKIFIQ